MKNWLKNNKTKIIILPAVLLIGLFIGDYTNREVDAAGSDIFDNYSFDTQIVTDKKTGVEYILIKRGINIYGITPRLNSDGKPILDK